MARALSSSASTVHYWAKTGFLPRSAREDVRLALRATGMAERLAKRLVDDAILGLEPVE